MIASSLAQGVTQALFVTVDLTWRCQAKTGWQMMRGDQSVYAQEKRHATVSTTSWQDTVCEVGTDAGEKPGDEDKLQDLIGEMGADGGGKGELPELAPSKVRKMEETGAEKNLIKKDFMGMTEDSRERLPGQCANEEERRRQRTVRFEHPG